MEAELENKRPDAFSAAAKTADGMGGESAKAPGRGDALATGGSERDNR